jgi:hypothetical protein
MTTTYGTKEDIAYLAGLFDGEGSFCIQVCFKKNKGYTKEYINFGPKLSISMLNGEEVLRKFQDTFGGSVYYYNDGMVRWYLGSLKEMLLATMLMMPWLIQKRKIAEVFAKTLLKFPSYNKDVNGWSRELRLEVAETAFHLNPATARRTKKSPEQYLERIRSLA